MRRRQVRRLSRSWRALPLLLLLGLVACPRAVPPPAASPQAPAPDAVLLITSQLEGTLEPCGCSASLRGGLSRIAALVTQSRLDHAHVAFLDAGNALFPSVESTPMREGQERAAATVLLDTFRQLGINAFATGPLDRSQSAGVTLPNLLSPGEARPLLTSARGTAVWALSGQTSEQLELAGRKAKAAGADFLVALVPLPFEEALALDWEGSDATLVVSSGPEVGGAGETDRLLQRGPRVFASPQSRGRSVLRVDLGGPPTGAARWQWQPGEAALSRELAALDGRIRILAAQLDRPGARSTPQYALRVDKARELQARRAALAQTPLPSLGEGAFTTRFVVIDPTLPEAPEVTALLTRHAREVSALNLAWARTHGQDCAPPTAGRPAFVGNDACAACHPDAMAFWETTRHARAWKTLEDVQKQGHLDCVGCHMVGWQQPGGVCRLDQTEGWTEVGCESCHGPGSEHIQDGALGSLVQRADAASCAGCHNAEHSPNFDFHTWVPRVVGPGHGAPADPTAPGP